MLKSFRLQMFLAAVVLLCLASHARAQTSNNTFSLTAEKLHGDWEGELYNAGWLYHAGDDASWAAKDYDDGAWEKLRRTQFNDGRLPRSRWTGAAWFRLHLAVDEQLAHEPVALRFGHWGASEIYVDGKLLERFGEITANGDVEFNPNRQPVVFTFGSGGAHVIAVRYSFQAERNLATGTGAWLARGEHTPGFYPLIQTARFAVADHGERGYRSRWYRLFVGILSALALLHFLLFTFYTRERANLFYSLFVVCLSISIAAHYILSDDSRTARASNLLFILFVSSFVLALPLLLTFLYVAFSEKFSRQFWVCLALCFITIVTVAVFVRSRLTLYVVSAALILPLVDAIRLIVRSLVKRREGARIIAVGVLLFACGILMLIAPDLLRLKQPSSFIELIREIFVYLAIPISVSIFLARNFARTNTHLEAQLVQVKELSEREAEHQRQQARLLIVEAENERRTKELEEARQLQLSMLPKSVPQLPNLEIAAYMKPATEVGGDYYDFHVGEDGTLTVAVGDATGHGLKAGTMVTATKSLFNNLAHETDIANIFRQSSAALKKMNLRGLFMAMTMMKIKGNRLVISCAGMPPALIYRAAAGVVEEIAIKAMPLGSPLTGAYQQRELTLADGDAIVLMSDGFPEMFNEQNEMLDYAKAKAVLEDVALGSSQSIINRFVEVGERWAGTRAQDDDVTFVVLKVTGGNGARA
ncbi:MAG: SpoIIE family protein phosphatase [Pyrinomonadaceae bacterium]